MELHESAEDYLESILLLSKKGNVRAVDICRYHGYSRPTVSTALKLLRENGYVNVDSDKSVTLTDEGLRVARGIYERHEVIARALIALGVSEKSAYADSCRIEHDISDESFQAIKKHLKYNRQRNDIMQE